MRRITYAVRAHLHYSWEEWEALPWHRQRTYLEELASDGKVGVDDGEVSMADLAATGVTVER